MNKKEEQSRNAYNKLAGNYEDTFDGRFTKEFKDMLVSNVLLTEQDAVLDVACGTGQLLNMLYEKCPIKGVGIDISDEMVKVAKSRYPMLEFLESGCAPLPFDDCSFDIITVSAAFHHFPKPQYFADEAKRVLKPNGKIYIAEVYFTATVRLLANIILPLYKSGDVKVYTTKELIKIFDKAGFEKISCFRKDKVQLLSAVKP